MSLETAVRFSKKDQCTIEQGGVGGPWAAIYGKAALGTWGGMQEDTQEWVKEKNGAV